MIHAILQQAGRGILLFLLLAFDAGAAGDRALFWSVESETTTIHLLGSIHLADDSFYPLRGEILQHFDKADTLVVELDISRVDPGEYMELLNRYGLYAGDETIRDHVSEKTWRHLKQVLDALQMPEWLLRQRKPAFLTMDLLTAALLRQGYTADRGIDIHLIERAGAGGKRIEALETLQQQMRMFAGLPHGEILLTETLNEIDNAEVEMRRLVDAWKAGDADALERMFMTEPEQRHETYRQLNDRLLYRRNDTMLEKIREYLQSDRRYFVIVGAAHLIGEKGIVDRLRRAGYRVERR